MKKILIYALILTICLCGIWSLSGCEEEKAVTDVTLTVPEKTPLFSIGEFDPSLYSLTIRYLDGTERVAPLTMDMIPDSEQTKFYSEGEQKIKVEYLGFDMEFPVAFGRYSFPDDIKFEAAPVLYDGKAHTVTVSGNIPAGTTVSYPLGNSFTTCGEHTVTAILSRENYVTKEYETTFTINKGVFDLSGYSFVSDSFTYNGEEQGIEADGTLPLGVSVSYALFNEDGEKLPKLSAKDVGTYEYVATFTSSNPNYEDIDEQRVTLTITPAAYDMTGVSLSDASYTYSGDAYSLKINGTLPAGVDVYYEVKNSQGNVVTTVKNADVYTVTASFRGDSKNYLPIDDMSATLTVLQKVPVLGKFYLDPVDEYLCDGLDHHPTVATVVDLEAEDLRIEYRIRHGTNVYEGDYQSESVHAGHYTLEAKFIYKNGDKNYAEIPSMYLSYTIAQINIQLPDSVVFPQTSSYIYNEKNQMPTVNEAALAESNLAVTYIVRKGDSKAGEGVTSYADAGTYTVEAEFSVADGNISYLAPASLYSTYFIEKKDVTPTNTFPTVTEYTYNNTDRAPVLANESTLNENGYAVTYRLYRGEDATGTPVSQAVDAGTYTVVAGFVYKGGTDKNYTVSSLTQTFTVKPLAISAVHKLKELVPNGYLEYMEKTFDKSSALPWANALQTLKDTYGIETTVRARAGYNKINGAIIPIPKDCGSYTLELTFCGSNVNYVSEEQYIFVKYDITKYDVVIPQKHSSQTITWEGEFVMPSIPSFDGLTSTVKFYKQGETPENATETTPSNYGGYYAYVTYVVADTTNYEISGENTTSVPFNIIPATFSLGDMAVDKTVFLYNRHDQRPTFSAEELAAKGVEAHYKVYNGFTKDDNYSAMLSYAICKSYLLEVSFTYLDYDPSVAACAPVYIPYVIFDYEKNVEYDGNSHKSFIVNSDSLYTNCGLVFNIILRNEGETTGPDLGAVTAIGKYTLEIQISYDGDSAFPPTSVYYPYEITRIKVPVGKNVNTTWFVYNGQNQIPTYLPPTDLDDSGYEGLSPKDLLEQKYGITYDYAVYRGSLGFHSGYDVPLTDYCNHGQYTVEVAFHSSSALYMADEEYKCVTFYIDPVTVYLQESFDPISYVFNGQPINLQMGVNIPNIEGVKIKSVAYIDDKNGNGKVDSGEYWHSPGLPTSVGTYIANVVFEPINGYGNYVFQDNYVARYIPVTIVPREISSSQFSLNQYIFVANGSTQKASIVLPSVFGENPTGFDFYTYSYQGFDNKTGDELCSLKNPGKYTVRYTLTQDVTNVIVVGDNVTPAVYSDRTIYTICFNVVVLDAKYNSAILSGTFYDRNKFELSRFQGAGYDGNLHGITPTYDGLALPDCFVVETLYYPIDGNGVYKDGVKDPGVYNVECTIKTIDPRNTFSVTLEVTFRIYNF